MLHYEKRIDLIRRKTTLHRSEVAQLFQKQLQIMSQQMDILLTKAGQQDDEFSQPDSGKSLSNPPGVPEYGRGDGLSSPWVPPSRRVKPGEDKPSPLPYSANAHHPISRMHQLSISQNGTATNGHQVASLVADKEQEEIIEVIPLSEEQKELWFVARTEDSASQAYNQSLGLRLRGPLHIAALRRALQAVVQRHESLWTVFDRQGEEQRILPSLALHIEHTDLSQRSEQEQEKTLELLQRDEAQRLFDLENGPLLRAHLLTLDENEHVLLFTIHHLIADGRSVGIVLHELSVLYTAFCTQKPHQLPAAFPYSSYVRQQREQEQSARMQEAESYWLERFVDIPSPLDFPTDYQRPPIKTFRGAKHHFTFDSELSAALKRLGLKHNCTLYTTLLAGYSAFLARITGQRDFVVPISSAGQFLVEGGDTLVGHCVRLLPIRVTVVGNPTLQDYLQMVQQAIFEAQEHRLYPFSHLVQKLKLPRDLSQTPLVATDFNLDVAGDLHFSGLATEVRNNVTDFAQFDFSINIVRSQNELMVECSYNTDLFAAETIERWGGYFRTLLQQMVQETTETFSQLTLLTTKEVRRFVCEQQVVQPFSEGDRSFLDLFAAQVERTPDAIVAACEQEQITYKTLDERAQSMACLLHEMGVTTETLVVLLAERGIAFLIAMLAIIKAGGVYLPLNTHWPEKQYARILERSRSRFVLTTAHYQTKMRDALQILDGAAPQMYLLDDLAQQAAQKKILSRQKPETLAYVIYTSGSTGVPKGAMVEHRGMLNHLWAKARSLALSADAVVAQNASQSFDISVWQFLSPLLVGGRVQIIPDSYVNDPEMLLEQVELFAVSVLEVVPSLLQGLFLLIEETGARVPELPHLRWLISTGEALPPKLARQWLSTYPAIPMMNGYGPTECSDDVTHQVIDAPPTETTLLVPVGQTVPNLELYVLDRDLHVVPPGVPGELYVGGIGVGRGYLNDPITTAEAFVPHPFQQKPGSRLYKTGDRVRIGRDGTFEFLGRIDHQVKVRGFRIELGEIEAHLYKHSAIQEAVVIVREDESGDKRLVAYIIRVAGADLNNSQARTWMREQIPEYMVPSAFVFLERFPLTLNGKIDIQALPAPEQSVENVPGTAPRDAVESMLVDIWKSVLHINEVGVHDNFFEMGGDSILSIKIIARLNDIGLKLTTREIFQYQTIAELASIVAQSSAFSAEQGEITGLVPLTPVQRFFFEELDLPNRHHYNQAVLLEMREKVDLPRLQFALNQLLKHHDMLRARFVQKGSTWECWIAGYDGDMPFVYENLSLQPGAVLEARANELQASLNISDGPVIRAAYFERGPQQSACLLIVAHHLVIDTVSWQILLEDLERVYRQVSLGEAVHLPPKTTSFKSWAEQLVRHAQTEALKQEQSYWLGLPWEQVRPLPRNYAEAPNSRDALRVVSTSLSRSETQVLLQEVPKIYHCQMNDALLTALTETFMRWIGDTALLLDFEGHGREEMFDDLSLSRTVGWFTSVAPLVLQLPAQRTTAQAIQSVKQQRQHMPNGGIGFGLLRYLSSESSEFAALPRPQVGFNYLGQMTPDNTQGALFSPLENAGAPVAKGGTLSYLIDVECMVQKEIVHIHWVYSEAVYKQETVEQIAQWYVDALRSIVAESMSAKVQQDTSYDTSLIDVDNQTLSELLLTVRFDDEQS